jgi:DNA-directed RNA polymerase subunit K/omega
MKTLREYMDLVVRADEELEEEIVKEENDEELEEASPEALAKIYELFKD